MGVRGGDSAPEDNRAYQRGFEAGYQRGIVHALDHVADAMTEAMAMVVGVDADEGPPVPRAKVSAAMHRLIHKTRSAAAIARRVPTE